MAKTRGRKAVKGRGVAALKPRTGRTPDILRKGGTQRDRTKYHRPTTKQENDHE